MKRIFLGIFTFCTLTVSLTFAQTNTSDAQVEEETTDAAAPIMTFESTEIDYGIIQQNAEPYREFHFTNTGDAPLIIKNAKGSCGCTVPEWSKEPVAPGESSIIKVRYATNRIGKFTKSITLTTNEVVSTRKLRIKGEVLKPDAGNETHPDNPISSEPKG